MTQVSKKPIEQLIPSQYRALLPAFDALQREILSPIETKAETAQTTATTAETDAATAQTTADTALTEAGGAQASSDDQRFVTHFTAAP